MSSTNSDANVHKVVMCANMFVKKDGTFLMLRRSEYKMIAPLYLHPPGGKVDPDEEPLQAAKRELLEEAGLTVRDIRIESIITEIKPVKPDENWLIFNFSGEYESGDLKSTPEGEFVWLTGDELLHEENLYPSTKALIKYIVDDTQGTIFASFIYTNCDITSATLKDLQICSK